MHNLQLTEDQELIVDTVGKYVADAVAEKAQEQDEHRVFAHAAFEGLAELGVCGLLVAEANGGAAMGFLPFAAALEAVGAHSSSLARLWVAQVQCAVAIEAAGADGLDEILAGTSLTSFVGPEHGLGFASGRVAGAAPMVAGASQARRFVVAAVDGGKPVLVSMSAEQVTTSPLRTLGLASAGCARVTFDGADAKVLATGEVALKAIARAQIVAWIGVAAAAVGGGLASIAAARKHAGDRIAFGKPLLTQQAVLRKLVECRRQVDAGRHLVWHAARLADLGQDCTDAALQARIAAVDAMVLAADEAIQIHGGYGYTVEYHVERHYRDGKTLEVLDGGAEALRDRLAARQFV